MNISVRLSRLKIINQHYQFKIIIIIDDSKKEGAVNFFYKNITGFLIIFLTAFFSTIITDTGFADSNPREILFRDADQALKAAKEMHAELYAPVSFEKGMEYYTRADKDFNKEKIPNAGEKLVKAVKYFKESINTAGKAILFFADVIKAREDALKANAIKYDAENWESAENRFRKAAVSKENGKDKPAKSYGEDAVKIFRLAELNGIKTTYLKPAWDLLEKLDDMSSRKYVPETIKASRELANTAEMLIERQRYELDESSKLAEQARYEASHAIYMAKEIKKMVDDDQTFESVMLSVELPLQKIADELGMSVQFNEGMNIPTENILQAIKQIQDVNRKYASEVSGKDTELKTMKKRLGKLSSFKARQDRIDRISASLKRKEGKAILDSDNVIIRLYGLNFAMGKSIIKPEYYTLLTKVKNIIAEFPGCKVIIEGHTDSKGGYDTNKRLSRQRAEAVKQYLRANSIISLDRIMAIGYGASKPIATNSSKDGRAMNRRIDVVIQPVQNW